MKTAFRESFTKDLRGVAAKGLLSRVREIIEMVERAESLAEIPRLKKLKGGGNFFRVRVGEYRMGLALQGDTVIFVRFLDRKDIYKRFP